jgi:hypothetical protein
MAIGLERLLLGGTLLVSGLMTKKVGEVGGRVQAIERKVAETPPPAPAPLPSMPLPTGYGLQVTGPEGEDLHIPVCLPPGFELESLVLRPDFLPAEEPAVVAPVQPVAARAPAPVAPPAPSAPAPREALTDGLQLVYAEEPGFVAHVNSSVPEGTYRQAGETGGLRREITRRIESGLRL